MKIQLFVMIAIFLINVSTKSNATPKKQCAPTTLISPVKNGIEIKRDTHTSLILFANNFSAMQIESFFIDQEQTCALLPNHQVFEICWDYDDKTFLATNFACISQYVSPNPHLGGNAIDVVTENMNIILE